VLQSNFKNIGSSAKKIERGEFAMQDTATKRDVDLSSPWETCFRPGQRVAMSMIFNSAKASNMYCPTCNEDNGDDFAEDEDTEWYKLKSFAVEVWLTVAQSQMHDNLSPFYLLDNTSAFA
jgi:hypothetical protein